MNEKTLAYLCEKLDSIHEIVLELQRKSDKPIREISTNLIKIDEAAIITGYSKIYLYELIHRKSIPYIKKGRSIRFDKGELEDWMRADRPNIFKETIKSLKKKK